jgi:thioredoxin-dependent peroxiredoxin
MSTLRLGDIAPDFTAETTEGTINFHEWLGNSWGVLFSHPADYTPVCTTELGATAKLKTEFDKRNVKVAALSVDGLESHHGWIKDINETQNTTVNFPIIADPEKKVALLYDMIHHELLRVIDSLQLTAKYSVATPANWEHGQDVVIVPAIKDEDIPAKFPKGHTRVKPYLRTTPQPNL